MVLPVNQDGLGRRRRHQHGNRSPYNSTIATIFALVTLVIGMAEASKIFGGLTAVVDDLLFEQIDQQPQDKPPVVGPAAFFKFRKEDFHWKNNYDMILVDITARVDGGRNHLEQMLDAMDGVEKINCFRTVCSAYVSIRGPLQALDSDNSWAHYIVPAMRYVRSGSVVSEGVAVMFADTARETFGVSGEGINIGVMSDSYNCLTTGITLQDDIASGDLPADVNVLLDYFEDDCIDEGRAMLQLVYDVAPNATLLYRTAFLGAADFAAGILELVDAGSDVIIDDIGYRLEPCFQDGVIAQAADEAVARGVPYFSSAGNTGVGSWEGPNGFMPMTANINGTDLTVHDFNGDGTFFSPLELEFDTEQVIMVLQWDQPFLSASTAAGGSNQCESNLVFIIEADGDQFIMPFQEDALATGECAQIIALPVAAFAADIGVFFGTVTISFGIALIQGPAPTYLKVLSENGIEFQFNVENPSTSCGHPNAATTAGVAAAPFFSTPRFQVDPPQVESFSSNGGTPIFFDPAGNRLPETEIREQPRFTAPDGTITTFFGEDNRFFGTSAAAPHAGAAAALLLENDPNLTPQEILTFFQNTAVDMDDPVTNGFDVGFDTRTGYGLINVLSALSETRGPSSAPSMNLNMTDAPTLCESRSSKSGKTSKSSKSGKSRKSSDDCPGEKRSRKRKGTSKTTSFSSVDDGMMGPTLVSGSKSSKTAYYAYYYASSSKKSKGSKSAMLKTPSPTRSSSMVVSPTGAIMDDTTQPTMLEMMTVVSSTTSKSEKSAKGGK